MRLFISNVVQASQCSIHFQGCIKTGIKHNMKTSLVTYLDIPNKFAMISVMVASDSPITSET